MNLQNREMYFFALEKGIHLCRKKTQLLYIQVQTKIDSSGRMLHCLRTYANIQTERRLLVLLICYGIIITLLHVVNIQTIFLIQPRTLQFIQKNSVYYGSRCYGCDDLIQNGVERKNLENVQLLIAVPSPAENFVQRAWIRETWGQKEPSLFTKKAIYFFLGKSNNQTINEAVRKENQRFHDIVQAGFNESYDNLRQAHVQITFGSAVCLHF